MVRGTSPLPMPHALAEKLPPPRLPATDAALLARKTPGPMLMGETTKHVHIAARSSETTYVTLVDVVLTTLPTTRRDRYPRSHDTCNTEMESP